VPPGENETRQRNSDQVWAGMVKESLLLYIRAGAATGIWFGILMFPFWFSGFQIHAIFVGWWMKL
jgi:hypothetical protein